MANNSTPDVYLLFGLQGGDSLTGASGKLIERQLTSIINQLEDKVVFSLKKINADDALKQLRTDINNTISSISKETENNPVNLNIKFNEKSVDNAIRSLENKIRQSLSNNINISPNITVVAGNGNTQVSTTTKSSNNTADVNNAASNTQKVISETKKNVENASNITKEFVDVINKFVKNSVAEIKRSITGTIDVPTKYNLRPIEGGDLKAIFSTWNKYLGSRKEIGAKELKDTLDAAGVDIFGNTLTGKTKNKAKDIQEIINQLIRNYSKYFSLSLDDGLKLEPRGFGQTLSTDKTFGSTAFKDAKDYQNVIGEIVKLLNLDVSNNKVTIGLKQLADLVDQIVSDDADIIKVKNDLSDLLSKTISESLSANPKVVQTAKDMLEKKEAESNITSDSTVSKAIKQNSIEIAKETEEAKQDVKELESSAVSVAENVEKTVGAVTESVERAAVSIDDIEKAINEKIKAFSGKLSKDVPLNTKTYFEDMALNLTDDIKSYRINSSMDGTILDSSQLSQLYAIINSPNSLQGLTSVFSTMSELFRNGKNFEATLNELREILYSNAFPKLSQRYKFDELEKYNGLSINNIYKALIGDNDGTTYRNILELKTLAKYLSNKDTAHTIEGYTSYLNSLGASYIGKKNEGDPYNVDDTELMLSKLSNVLENFYEDVEFIKTDASGNISYNKQNVKDIIDSHTKQRNLATDISNAITSDEYKAIENLFSQTPEKIEPVKEAVSEVKAEITSVAAVAESLKETAQEVATTAKPAVESVKDKVEEVAQAEQKATDNAEKFTEQIAQTDDKAVPALDDVEQEIKKVSDVEKELSNEIVPMYKKADNAQMLFKDSFDKIPKTLKNIKDDEVPKGVIESVEQIENQLTLTEEYIQSIPSARKIKKASDIEKELANEFTPIYKKADNAQILITDAFDKIPKKLKNINDDEIPKGVVESVEQIENQLILTEEYIQSIPPARKIKNVSEVEKELANEFTPMYKKAGNAQILIKDVFDKIPKTLKNIVDSADNSKKAINTINELEGQLSFDMFENLSGVGIDDNAETKQDVDNISDAIEEATEDLKEYKEAADNAAESTDKLGNAAEKSKNKIPKSLDNRISKTRGKRENVEYELGLYDISNPTPTIMLYEELYNRIVKLREAMDSDDYSSLDGINNYDEALQETNALLSQADELYKKVKEDLKLYNNEAKAAERAAQSAKLIAEQFPTGANAANFDDDTYSLARMEQRLATVTKNLTNLESSQLKAPSVEDLNVINTLYDRLIRANDLIEQLKAGAFTENSDKVDAIEEINDHLGITEQRIKEIINTTANVPTDAMSSIVERYNKALAEYRATPGADKFKDLYQLDFVDDSDIDNIEAVRPRVVALTKETERLTKAKADLDNASKRESTTAARVNEIYQKAYDYYNKYYVGISKNKELDNQWTTLLSDLNNGMYKGNAEGARQALTELQVRSKQANVEVSGLWNNLKKLFTAHFGSFSVLSIIGTMRNGLRAMYQDVLEIDKAMTELRKVTDLTESQYESFGETAARIARNVSGSISDTINSVADFARLGFSVDEASSLAEAALVYKNVGDGLSDINEASESIISTIKAFSDIEASDAMSIIDKFNEVGNNFAISSSGIGTALQKSAASLASANNTLDESIALITAGNAVIQNPETVGTTMKTLSMFLRASKTEAEEAGIETEGMATSVSKLRKEILSLTKVNGGSGVDIMLDEDTYKSTYQILRELSLVWEDLSDVTQANILERIAGKRNANIAASVITNFSVAEEALATSTNSAGSALKENEKYLDSIAGHANKTKIAFEDLSQNFIESDFIKAGADSLTVILNGLNEILKVLTSFPTAMGLIAAAMSSFGNMGIITRVNADLNGTGNLIQRMLSSVRLLGKSFEEIANDTRAYGNIFSGVFGHSVTDNDKNVLNIYRDSISDAISNNKKTENGVVSFDIDGFDKELKNTEVLLGRLSTAGKDSADKIKDLGIQFGNGKISEQQFRGETAKLANAQKASTASTIGLTIATTLLNTALTLGISFAIQTVVTGLFELINGYDNAVDKIKESTKSIKDSESNIESYNSELKTTRDRIKELESLDTLNLFEKDELSNLRKINSELEDKIRLEKLSIEQAKDEARANALMAYASMGGQVYGKDTNNNVYTESGNFVRSIPAWFGGTTIGQIQGYITDYKKATKQLEDFTEDEINAEGTRANSIYKAQQENLKKILDVYKNQASNISQIILGLDPKEDKDAIDFLNSILSTMRELNGEGTLSTFTDVWESADYTTTTKKLEELAKQGKLTVETFEKVEGIETFKAALEAIGITDISDIIQAIIDRISESGNEAEKAAGKISIYAEQLAKIKDSIDDAATMRANIQSAFDTLSEGGYLSDDDVKKFREYPELFSKFTKTTKGWTIGVEALKKAYSDLAGEARNAIQQARDDTVDEITVKRTEYARQKETHSFSSPNSYSEAKEYKKEQDALSDLNNEIAEGEQSLRSYDTLLQMYEEDLTATAKTTEDTVYDIKTLSNEVSTGATAFKEMQENGRLSISTFESLTALGDEYRKTLTIENGVIKFNVEAFKDLTAAKAKDELATAGLALAEAKLQETYEASHSEYNYTITDRTKQLVNDAQQRFDAISAANDNLDYTWEQALRDDSKSTIDSDYKKRLSELKDVNKGTIEDERQFVKDWTTLNEEMYKATDPDQYEENLREISEYIKGLDGLLDTYLEKWDKVNSYDENNIANRRSRLAESRRVNYDTYGDPNSLFYNLDTYEKNETDQAKYEADTLKLQLDRGLIDYQNFITGVKRIRESARDREGNYLLDMSFVSGYEDLDKQFDEQLDIAQRFNDKSLDDEAEYIRRWKALNDEVYKNVDVTKYESNLKAIADYEKDLLDRRFKDGLISAEDYRTSLINLWNDNDAVLGEGVLNEWLSSAADNEKEELDRLYKEGKISAKEYFDYIQALWENNKNILGQRTQEEWLEEAWKNRAETEKTYWEQQKELAAQYYDDEIKKLQDVQEEEERVNKAEELRLNLIKARQTLEDAKNNRNQLFFNNGTFEYMADQEAVISAEEEVTESLKAIKENELQEQISLLEQQKDEALLFYSNVIGLLEYYINGTREIESSDSEVLDRAINSESGNYFLRLLKGEVSLDDVKEELKQKFSDKPEPDTTKPDKKVSMPEWASSILEMGTTGLFALTSQLISFAKTGADFGGIATSAQDIASMATDNIFNNSNITYDNSVNVGDIHMTIQGGTSQEMLDQFAHKLGSTISTLIPRAITS